MDDEDDDLSARLRALERLVPTSRLTRLWKGGRSALGAASAVLGSRLKGDKISEADAAMLEQLAGRLGELKGMAMKAGQILSYVDLSLSPDARKILASLQTSSPRTAFPEIRAVVEASLSERGKTLAAAMRPEPLAVASIGQVHRATLPDGTEVAVKVLTPGIEQALQGDFKTASGGVNMAALLVPGAGASAKSFFEEAKAAVLGECDFAAEARAQQEFGALFEDHPIIRIPEVLPEWSSSKVLTTRWTPGESLDRFLAASPAQAERDRFGVALFDFYIGTLYRHGLFHADPHPGNYAFRDDGTMVVYDFGCIRRFDRPTVAAYVRLGRAVQADDTAGIRRAIEGLGGKAPPPGREYDHLRLLLRSFFAPLLKSGPQRMEPGGGATLQTAIADKRALGKLQLPGKLLFLFRLRFGLFSVLSRMGAVADWSAIEQRHAAAARVEGAG